MYISNLCVNSNYLPSRDWLKNIYRVHQRLCMAFPSAHRKDSDRHFLNAYKEEDFEQAGKERDHGVGFLFRVEPDSFRTGIIVQSAIEPDWEYAFQNLPFLAKDPECKQYDPRFQKGEILRFRLIANPTKKIDTKSGPDGKRRNGRRVPVAADKLMDWISRKGAEGGFEVDEKKTLCQPSYLYFNKSETQKARMFAVRYDGLLTVTEPENLAQAICAGIGPAKGFGFGLLSVARA